MPQVGSKFHKAIQSIIIAVFKKWETSVGDSMKSKTRTARSIAILITTVCVFILGLWILAIYLGLQPAIKNYTQQPFADAFSGINALFAGCAFGGVILTIWLQIYELQETRDELQKTAMANQAMAESSIKMATHSDERTVLELFQTYCSDYFQVVKDSSMSVLIPCVASKEYCDFVASRFFVAGQLAFPPACWEKVSRVTYCKNFEEFVQQEQRYRYKLDELINFFTLLVGRSNSREIIARCDFSYSWWRPLLWMIAIGQENHYKSNPVVQKYATPLYLKNVVERLDEIYGFLPFQSDKEFWEFFLHHPKILSYGLDDEYQKLLD